MNLRLWNSHGWHNCKRRAAGGDCCHCTHKGATTASTCATLLLQPPPYHQPHTPHLAIAHPLLIFLPPRPPPAIPHLLSFCVFPNNPCVSQPHTSLLQTLNFYFKSVFLPTPFFYLVKTYSFIYISLLWIQTLLLFLSSTKTLALILIIYFLHSAT